MAGPAVQFACLLLPLLVAAWFTNANGAALKENATVPTGKVLNDAADSNAAAGAKFYKVGGRKKRPDNVNRKDVGVHSNNEKEAAGGQASKASRANEGHVGISGDETTLKVKNAKNDYKQPAVSHYPGDDYEFHDAGFVDFTADYFAPRHHPPKNN